MHHQPHQQFLHTQAAKTVRITNDSATERTINIYTSSITYNGKLSPIQYNSQIRIAVGGELNVPLGDVDYVEFRTQYATQYCLLRHTFPRGRTEIAVSVNEISAPQNCRFGYSG